jgi:FixJ family two-component response regulator
MIDTKLVSIVDDDESVRESLPDLLRSFGFEVAAFASAEEFLAADSIEETGCLILDIVMPGMSGLELQEVLARQERNIPIVFITSLADDKLTSTIVQGGAMCIFKPFSETAIVEAVNDAFVKS